MTINDCYFFDSYAIIEIIKGNKNYDTYLEKERFLSQQNVFEVYFKLIKYSEDFAKAMVKKYYEDTIQYSNEIIEEAAKMRFDMKKRDVSMTDCIGYIIAKKLNIKFLTGDEQFRDLPNVEFVK